MRLRLALVCVLLLGLSGTATPARAASEGNVAFQGFMHLGPGMASYCVGTGPIPNLPKCPGVGSGNQVTFIFTGTAGGQNSSIVSNKCGLGACVEAGTWNMAASGSAYGWCEMWNGVMSGSLSPVISLGNKSKSRSFTLTFVAVGATGQGTMELRGVTNKGENVVGSARWAHAPGTGSSCLNKNAKSIIVQGELHFAGL